MRNWVKLLVAGIVLLNCLYNITVPLHPDEAYYWVWSKNLELSYYDHPPLIAYAIKLFSIVGDSEGAIRLTTVAAMTVSAFLVYRTAGLLFNQAAAEAALLFFLLSPMTQLGYLIVTPDSVLALCWSLTIYLVSKALFDRQRGYLALAGVAIGTALLAKYTAVLLPLSLLLFLAFTPRFRARLASRELAVAALLAVVVFSPVLIWNSVHDWSSFSYQFKHGVAAAKVMKWQSFVEFLGGQALVANPLFFVPVLGIICSSPLKLLREPRKALLVWLFIVPFCFFGYHSLFKKSELNWAIPMMLSGSILLAGCLKPKRRQQLLRLGGGFVVVAILIFKLPELVPVVPAKLVMKNQFLGYEQLFRGLEFDAEREFILSDNYKHAAEIGYYFPGQPDVYIIGGQRPSQYSIWLSRLADAKGKNAIWIGAGQPPPAVVTAFSSVEYRQELVFSNATHTKRLQLFYCTDFLGLPETVTY